MTATTFHDDPESKRITQVIQHAADAAYQRRANLAERRVIDRVGIRGLTRLRRAAGFTEQRWVLLMMTTRNVTRADFQKVAAALSVSPRWLAIGSGGMTDAPEGWFHFGTHVDVPGPLEFSKATDDGGMPLWERPKSEVAA